MIPPDPFEPSDDRDDAAYWDDLAGRVSILVTRVAKQSALDWVAESRARLVVASVALAAALTLAMQTASSAAPAAEWIRALAPSDALGQTIILSGSPPAIGALLLDESAERAK